MESKIDCLFNLHFMMNFWHMYHTYLKIWFVWIWKDGPPIIYKVFLIIWIAFVARLN